MWPLALREKGVVIAKLYLIFYLLGLLTDVLVDDALVIIKGDISFVALICNLYVGLKLSNMRSVKQVKFMYI